MTIVTTMIIEQMEDLLEELDLASTELAMPYRSAVFSKVGAPPVSVG